MSDSIAMRLMETLTARLHAAGFDYPDMLPEVVVTETVVSVTVAGTVVWDSEDESDHPEDGETYYTALQHATRRITSIIRELSSMTLPSELIEGEEHE